MHNKKVEYFSMTQDKKGALQWLLLTNKTSYQVLKIFFLEKLKKIKISLKIIFKMKTKLIKKSRITLFRI